MEAGIILFVIRDGVTYLENKGLITSDGKFGTFTPQDDANLAKLVEDSLKVHGVVVPDEVDKVLTVLPLVLSIAGVK